MIKRIIVAVVLLLASAVFAFIGMWIAPYAVGVLESAITYNIILAVVLAIITIITIILLCKKRLRIYSLLFIPHIIALGLIMLHVGNNIYYMGSGFIRVNFKPFTSIPRIQTTSGRVIFKDAYNIHLYDGYGKVFFYKDYYLGGFDRIYDVNGNCILVKPEDDKEMRCFNEGFWSKKEIKKDNDQIYRVRFFDMSGDYIFTRFYKSYPYFLGIDSYDNKEFIKETTEDVVELSDGIKKIKESKSLNNISAVRQSNSGSLASSESSQRRVEQVKEPEECPRCHGVGKHKRIKCTTCYGEGMVSGLRNPNSFAPPPPVSCPACDGQRYVNCPRDPDTRYSNPFRKAPSSPSFNPYNNYNYDVAPVQYSNERDPCGACNGTGKCTSCGGQGLTYNNLTDKWYRCDVCRQSGQCVACHGRGY